MTPARSASARVPRLAALLLALLAGLVVTVQPVSAHALSGTRFDAPVPLTLLYAAAAVTVLVTALAATRLVTTDARERTRKLLPPRATRVLVRGAQALALLVFAVALSQGLTGRQVRAENVATLLAWAVVFDGLALLAALLGSPWRVLAPWTAIYDGLAALEGRDPTLLNVDTDPSAEPGQRVRLASWPALVAFLLLIGVFENLTVLPESPARTAVLLAAYALVMLGGLLLVGRDWLAHADPIGVFLDLVARVAPLRVARDDDGALAATLRAPWTATSEPVASLGRVAFVVAAVYTISFDGFTSTPAFRGLLFWSTDVLEIPYGVAGVALYLLGFALFLAVFALTARAADALGGRSDTRAAARRLAPTVLPIAVAYEFAHYGAYVTTSAARLLEVALAGVGYALELAPLAGVSVQAYWTFEVLVIVLGHVVAVLAAHRAALARYDASARRAHLPLTVLMVAYTVVSLWIISQPVVA